MDENRFRERRLKVTVTWGALFKVLFACLLAYLAIRLYEFGELLLLALLIAIAFRPLMQWTQKHHWPRWAGVTTCGLILLSIVGVFVGVLVPIIASEGSAFLKKLPELQHTIFDRLPSSLQPLVQQMASAQDPSKIGPAVQKFLWLGGHVLQGVIEFFVVLVVAIYFVADGPRLYRWFNAFLPEKDRRKMDAASEEITSVASHYILGQFITSVLCAAYAFGVLAFLHVPNAVLLAFLAAVFDVLPLIGFFLFTIPAVAVAFSVSPSAAAIVAAAYTAYHLFENYFIVPMVYGNALRLSTLAVLVSCLAAGAVAGVVGVIIALPLVAIYPVVEKHWLRRYLQPDTVEKHEQLDAEEFGRKEHHRWFRRRSHAT